MKLDPDLIHRTIIDEDIIIPVGQTAMERNGVFVMSPVGARIWTLLEEGKDTVELVPILLEENEVEEAVLKEDVDAFLAELIRLGLLLEDQVLDIQLLKAQVSDAQTIWQMQNAAFAHLLEKYQDYDTNPGNESLEQVRSRLEQPFTYFYFICVGEEKVGAIRIVDRPEEKRISPLFVLPEHRGRGYAQKAIELCERLHGKEGWTLSTILEEKGNCHLYEKMGYLPTGQTEKISDRLTLINYRK